MRHLHWHFSNLVHDIWFWDVVILLIFLTVLIFALAYNPGDIGIERISPYRLFR
jgi:hypothetical protein